MHLKKLLPLLSLLPFLAAPLARAEMSRAEFSAAMSRITEGTKAGEVVKLLGKPDDIHTERDPGGLRLNKTTEVWGYGTSGHLTFPTLGIIYMSGDKVQYVFGGNGAPPPSGMFAHEELTRLLRLIDATSGVDNHNPPRLIQAVNALQPLGKDKALAAIEEYLRVSTPYGDDERESIFFILRLLFEIPADPGYMPRMGLGAPQPMAPNDLKVHPLFPLELSHDIPLNLVFGYALGGVPESPESHIKYFRENGTIRAHPLAPGDDPLGTLGDAMWIYGKDESDRGKLYIARQLLQLVATVYRFEPDGTDAPFSGGVGMKMWEKAVKEVATLHIRWDPEKNIYVFPDGHSLPEIPKPIYQRQIWEIPAPGPAGQVILERQDEKNILIIIDHPGTEGVPVPKTTVRVMQAIGDKPPVLGKLDIPAGQGENASHTTYITAKLPAGEKVFVQVLVNDKTLQSPSLTP